jgi:hypothetical protein
MTHITDDRLDTLTNVLAELSRVAYDLIGALSLLYSADEPTSGTEPPFGRNWIVGHRVEAEPVERRICKHPQGEWRPNGDNVQFVCPGCPGEWYKPADWWGGTVPPPYEFWPEPVAEPVAESAVAPAAEVAMPADNTAEIAQRKDREYILVALGVKHRNLTLNYGPEPPSAVAGAASAVQEIRVWLATRWEMGELIAGEQGG